MTAQCGTRRPASLSHATARVVYVRSVKLTIRVLTCVALLLFAVAAPAAAKDKGSDRVVIVGPVVVPAGQQVDDVVVAHGEVAVAGRVNGDLVVADGKV